RDGERKTIARDIQNISVVGQEIMSFTVDTLSVHDLSGKPVASHEVGVNLTSFTRADGDVFAVTFAGKVVRITDGSKFLEDLSARGRFVAGEEYRISFIHPGPAGTIAFGSLNGDVGLFDLASGSILETRRLNGRPVDWKLIGDRFVVTTLVGDSTVIDLSTYTREYCDLLREIWAETPVVWTDGEAVVATPPSDHVCSGG
ncbi:MAG: hypothetical protein JRG91_14195, partial [Deltaproteobacteria bacterium]|nr:hypothetical protein [Deltaproteobacteria bacterium]